MIERPKIASGTLVAIVLACSACSPAQSQDDAPPPPEFLDAGTLESPEAAAQALVALIDALVEPVDDLRSSAEIASVSSNQIVLVYRYTYGWRAFDRVEQSLFYVREESQWRLTETIQGEVLASSFVGDLTGNGISEMVAISTDGFRNEFERTQTVMTWVANEGQYKPSNLQSNTYTIEGNCSGAQSRLEELSFLSEVRPSIAILRIERFTEDEACERKLISVEEQFFVWDTDEQAFARIEPRRISN